jgi:cytochrome c-type protein NapC
MDTIKRFFRWLFKPSARLSVFVLLLAGTAVGAVAVAGTQLMVHYTGSVEFCGGACHSMQTHTLPEFKDSKHGLNRLGIEVSCSSCHLPHSYPAVLFAKAKAGIKDIYHEIRGTISTAEKYEKERWRMANLVWDQMRADNSANCRSCHDPMRFELSKQSAMAQRMHLQVQQGKATCIDCHKGVAHKEPEEPEEPAKAASAQ